MISKRFEVEDKNLHLNLDTKRDLDEFRKIYVFLGRKKLI